MAALLLWLLGIIAQGANKKGRAPQTSFFIFQHAVGAAPVSCLHFKRSCIQGALHLHHIAVSKAGNICLSCQLGWGGRLAVVSWQLVREHGHVPPAAKSFSAHVEFVPASTRARHLSVCIKPPNNSPSFFVSTLYLLDCINSTRKQSLWLGSLGALSWYYYSARLVFTFCLFGKHRPHFCVGGSKKREI